MNVWQFWQGCRLWAQILDVCALCFFTSPGPKSSAFPFAQGDTVRLLEVTYARHSRAFSESGHYGTENVGQDGILPKTNFPRKLA
jgi:hypothetical protein